MKEKVKFYKCPTCGNVIDVVEGDIERIKCCGGVPFELIANTVEADVEKHIPVYKIDGNEIIVQVGKIIHPMEERHYIMFIGLITDDRVIRVDLNPGDKPIVRLPYVKNSVIYEYCNIHGLWKNIVK